MSVGACVCLPSKNTQQVSFLYFDCKAFASQRAKLLLILSYCGMMKETVLEATQSLSMMSVCFVTLGMLFNLSLNAVSSSVQWSCP